MRAIISYGARRRWRRRNAYIYKTQRTHTRLTYMLSSAHPHQHACMHACMLSRPPAHSYATLYTQPPLPAPHPTIHITPTYTICCTTTHPRTLQHTQPPTHCNTHTQLRTFCVPPRSRRDRRQETAQTHITPTAITTTMTMCDDDHM